MVKNFKYYFLVIVSIIFMCIGMTFKYIQDDTFYIVKLGDFIMSNGIDLIDHYSWISSLSYTYPHWLFDCFVYIIYDNFSFYGIYVMTIILFAILVFSFYYVNFKLHRNKFFSLFISIIAVFRLNCFAVARSQLVSLTLFLLEVYSINQLLNTGKKRYIVFLSFGSLLIANIHATTWLFYFVLFLPFLGEYFINWLMNRKKELKKDICIKSKLIIEKFKYFNLLVISFIMSFFMGIFSPSKICYSYVIRIMLGNTQEYLLEHLPLVVIEHPFFLVVIIILIIVLLFSNTKIYLRELFMISGLIFMSLSSIRHLSFFYTIGLLYIVIICCRYLKDSNDYTLDILGNNLMKNNIIYCFVILFIICFSIYNFYVHSKEEFVLEEKYPVKAVEFIKSNLDYKNIKIFNEYNFGSYLLFNDIPVFIDSRCDLYLKEFNNMNDSIFDDMSKIMLGNIDKIKKYDFTHILLSKSSTVNLLIKDIDNYEIIYEDDNFVLFEQVGGI